MRHTIRTRHCTVTFEFAGLSDGKNFSRRFDPDHALENLLSLSDHHGATSCTRIVPGLGYEVCESLGTGKVDIPSAALATVHPNDALLLLPADCIPFVLVSTAKPALALIHAGRRELDANIIEKTITYMTQQFGVDANELVAYLGPGIKQESYRLPASVVDTLEHHGWQPFFKEEGETILLDTFGFARSELRRLGVPETAIGESLIDTLTDPNYYSHYGRTRLGQPAGANGCAVVMKPSKEITSAAG